MRRPSSPLARAGCVAYAILILYGSLTPFTGWRDNGIGPLAYLTAPLPRHLPAFDVVVNILAYIPFGALLVLAVYPRLRSAGGAVAAALIGFAVSAAVEAIQTYLPARVASNVDLLTNGLGTLVGAIAASIYAEELIDRGRLARLRARWFVRDAAAPLVLIALWPLAQIHPGPMLFGNGAAGVAGWFGDWLADLTGIAAPASTLRFGPAQFVAAEVLATVTGLLAVGFSLALLTRPRAPRGRLLVALVGAALGAKAIAYGVTFGPEHAFAWLTPGALTGLALGVLGMAVAAVAPSELAFARLALIAVTALLLLVNLVPDNPYHAAWIQAWHPGKLAHFSAAARWLATMWPYALLLWLLWVRRDRSGTRDA
ncbi:MAG TPA: VanZ family protein [Burkholderiaceae bacterium]